MANIITISNSALKQMSRIISSKKCDNLLLSIKGGGCNGFNYKISPNNNPPNKIDEVIIEKDVKLTVCGHSMMFLMGTKIDWQEDIMGSIFVFDNPNAKSQCGCGTSFGIG